MKNMLAGLKSISKSFKFINDSEVLLRQFLLVGLSSGTLLMVPACSSSTIRSEAASTKAVQAKTSEEKPQRATTVTEAHETKPSTAHMEASAEYHFSLAQAYVAEGNPDRAIEEYKITLMFDPNSPLVYARLATEYIKKGMLSAAMETCKEALQRDPAFLDARLMLAGLYSTARDAKHALAEYDRVLKQDPKHEEAVIYKAQVLLEDGQPVEAVQSLRQFSKKNPESALTLYYLGRAEQQQNHFKEAVISYRKALKARPGFSQAAMALGFLYEEKKMNKEAITLYKELYEESQDVGAANRLATIYMKDASTEDGSTGPAAEEKTRQKYRLAVPYLEAVEASDPEDLNVRVKLGLIRMELKDYDKAIATFTGILEKSPDSDRIHYYLGSIYEELKKYELAISHLKQIKTTSKLFSDATLHVAYLMKQDPAGGVEASRKFMQDAITKSPENPSFYIFTASLEEEGKNLPGAVSMLEGAVKKFPEDEKVRYYLGSLYDRRGEIDKGLEQMEAILRVNPENVDALNYIGYTWTLKGMRLNDAEKLLKRALGLRPNNAYIQDSWGWYLFVRGRVSEAVVELEKAVSLKPTESTILEHLADAYMRSNLAEKALSQYRSAVRYAEDDSLKHKLQLKVDSLQRDIAQQGTPAPAGASGNRAPATSGGAATGAPGATGASTTGAPAEMTK